MLRTVVLERALCCVTWSPRVLRHAAPSLPQRPDSLHRMAKTNRADHPICYLDMLMKTASESIEATLRRRRILLAGFVARVEGTRLPKCVMFGELVGGTDCVGGQEKKWMGVFPERPQSYRHRRRPVDDCSPGQGGMAQEGGTRSGTFHGEMDRCRESQGSITVRSSMPGRDGKDQGKDSPNEASSCWFARHS